MTNFDALFGERYSDGYIILIIKTSSKYDEDVLKRIEENNDRKIVFGYTKNILDYHKMLQKVLAYEHLLDDNETLLKNEIQVEEVEALYLDAKNHLKEYINNSFSFVSGECVFTINLSKVEDKSALSYNRRLGVVFDEVYNKYPIINLELINKHKVVGAYKKARIEIIEKILTGRISSKYKGNSPEATIYACVIEQTGLLSSRKVDNMDDVLDCIEKYFKTGRGTFKGLINTMKCEPYGLRGGILPILVAYVLYNKSIKIDILINNVEQHFDAKLLDQVVDSPGEFEFIVDTASIEQKEYIIQLSELFTHNVENINHKYIYKQLCDWYANLPKLTKFSIGIESLSNIRYKRIKKVLSIQETNSREVIYKKIPSIYKTELLKVPEMLHKDMLIMDKYLDIYSNNLLVEVNKLFGFDMYDDFLVAIKDWLAVNEQKISTLIFNESQKEVLSALKSNNYTNQQVLLNAIAKRLVGLFIEDWSAATKEQFINALVEFLKIINNYEYENDSIILEIQGIDNETITKRIPKEDNEDYELVINQIDSIFEDFGDLYTNEQKISLLLKIMKGLM